MICCTVIVPKWKMTSLPPYGMLINAHLHSRLNSKGDRTAGALFAPDSSKFCRDLTPNLGAHV